MELLMAVGTGVVVLGVFAAAAMNLGRSMFAADHYARASNDGSRLVDYMVQDLRRAVAVGVLSNGISTPLKNGSAATVSEGVTLTISIPDYYASNTPGGAGSAFRTPRYARNDLNTDPLFNTQGPLPLNGTVQWEEGVTKVGGVETTRFSPVNLGSDQVEVRYYRAPRSRADSTICYFRAEHLPGNARPNFAPEELASWTTEGGGPVTLTIQAPDLPPADVRYGKLFLVKTSFEPQFQRCGIGTPPAEQRLTVLLRNGRRD